MGLSQALSTGVSGLVSHQKAMDNIGNNLANINTVGYKKGVYQFSTMLEQALRGGTGASGSTGTINPISLGLGTQTASISKVFTQGSLETTGAANDMAIDGNGFFVVSNGSGYAYTRDGSFFLNDDGNLMSSSGLYVQGTMAVRNSDGSITIPQDAKLENLVIPIGSTGGMSKTSTVSFSGNLNSTQSVASGLKLFGTNSPTANDLQAWMSTSFNSTDATWNALENESFSVSRETLDKYGLTLPQGAQASVDSNGVVPSHVYYAMASDGSVSSVFDLGFTDYPASADSVAAAGYVPVVQEITTINGGNVQTSQALGVKVPDALANGGTAESGGKTYSIQNDYTYPAWFYESTGATLSYQEIVDLNNNAADPTAASVVDQIWPNGFNDDSTMSGVFPRSGETYAAGLDTPLEHIYVNENGKWTQLFSDLKEGDEVTVAFDKGQSRVEATFVYNHPNYPEAFGNQQKLDYEQSYTLEHFLTFLAGDVDQAGVACAAITPAMFGAVPTDAYPDGDPDPLVSPDFDQAAYQDALANVSLAKSDSNYNSTGGVMGLIDVPPQISSTNGGADSYDAPMETAGAFSREGVSQVTYQRWDGEKYVDVKSDSFSVSLVSNLGSENALSGISISCNNVANKTLFSAEGEYSAAQGGSATASVTFYDSLGNARTATVRMTLVSEDSNSSTWRWYADCADDTDFAWQADPNTGELVSNLNVGTGLFRFDADGNFISGSEYSETGGIVVNLENQGVDDTISVSIINGLDSRQTQDLDFSALTFTATKNSLTLSNQNGAPPGALDSYEVGSDGTIYGIYSTGKYVPLGQLVLATVPNMNGMTAGSNNLYYTTPASGDPQYGYPDTGGRGEILQYQLETSNVDMSEEFTKMIAIERGYQANSRIITTADEMLQELLSMVR